MVFIVEPKSNLNANDIPANIATNIPESKSGLHFSQAEDLFFYYLVDEYH